MKKRYSFLLLIALCSCHKPEVIPDDKPDDKPVAKACFTYSPQADARIGDTIKFSDCSENADSYLWDFGDGDTSAEKSANHIYKQSGEFQIKLEVKNDNNVDTLSKSVLISDDHFTDFHNTASYVQWANGTIKSEFDLDRDKINDIVITNQSNYSNHVGEYFTKITPLNGYEIVYTDHITTRWQWNPTMTDTLYLIDTVMLPKVFDIGDTLSVDGNYTKSTATIYYSLDIGGIGGSYSGDLFYEIEGRPDYFYLAFRKITGDNHQLAWLRVSRTTASASLCLNSCRFYENVNFVIIK